MTPDQERAKLKAQEVADRNYRLGNCFTCNGIGFTTCPDTSVVKCSVCGGTGKQIERRSTNVMYG